MGSIYFSPNPAQGGGGNLPQMSASERYELRLSRVISKLAEKFPSDPQRSDRATFGEENPTSSFRQTEIGTLIFLGNQLRPFVDALRESCRTLGEGPAQGASSNISIEKEKAIEELSGACNLALGVLAILHVETAASTSDELKRAMSEIRQNAEFVGITVVKRFQKVFSEGAR